MTYSVGSLQKVKFGVRSNSEGRMHRLSLGIPATGLASAHLKARIRSDKVAKDADTTSSFSDKMVKKPPDLTTFKANKRVRSLGSQ